MDNIINWLEKNAKRTTIDFMGENHGYDVCIWYFPNPRNIKKMEPCRKTGENLEETLISIIKDIEDTDNEPQYA